VGQDTAEKKLGPTLSSILEIFQTSLISLPSRRLPKIPAAITFPVRRNSIK